MNPVLDEKHLKLFMNMVKNSLDDINQIIGSETILTWSAKWNYLPITKMLIDEYNASIDFPNSLGETALVVATRAKNVELVRYLLDHGASIHVQDQKGNTAFDVACYDSFSIIPVLLREVPYIENVKKIILLAFYNSSTRFIDDQSIRLLDMAANRRPIVCFNKKFRLY